MGQLWRHLLRLIRSLITTFQSLLGHRSARAPARARTAAEAQAAEAAAIRLAAERSAEASSAATRSVAAAKSSAFHRNRSQQSEASRPSDLDSSSSGNALTATSSSSDQPSGNMEQTSMATPSEPPVGTQSSYPKTFPNHSRDGQSPERLQIFEPALKQFPDAFSLADPRFENSETEAAWRQARSQVIAHLLQIIANSPWQAYLVLRGSLLLQAWLGDSARDPKDIDWVFQPSSIGKDDPLGLDLFNDLTARVALTPQIGTVEIEVDQIRTDEIWTYERASGRRILFPWQAPGLPPGEVQMDVVFREALPDESVRVALGDLLKHDALDRSLWLWAASPALSLAWKILWLESDCYPQGKDLYDAVLLAEQVSLPLPLLATVLEQGGYEDIAEGLDAGLPMDWDQYSCLDWENFQREYPQVQGDSQAWRQRFCDAIAPAFKQK